MPLHKYIPSKVKGIVPILEAGISDIDWSKTKAYCLGFGGIYFNVKGRYRQGIVDEEEYGEIRNWVIEELHKFKDPKNRKKIIKNVFKKEDIYSGPHIGEAPDLVVEMEDGYAPAIGPFHDPAVQIAPRSGNHRNYGILLAMGKGIKKGVQIDGAKIIDIAPTILYFMKESVPKDMDGRVLVEILENSFRKENPIRYKEKYRIGRNEKKISKETLSDEEEEGIKERLRRLGYL